MNIRRKGITFLLLAAFFLSALAGCAGDTADTTTTEAVGQSDETEANAGSDEVITLRLGENHPADYPTTLGDLEFSRLVEERTDGRIKIEVYYGGQLGDETSVIEQVVAGAIDFTRVNVAPMAQFNNDFGVLNLPYLFTGDEHLWTVLDGEIGDQLLASLDSANLVGLTFYDSGTRNFYNSVKEIHSPADMVGLKIRVQENELNLAMIEALGASAQALPYGEVYSSIQTGVVDGAENNWPSYDSSGHFEVAPYISTDGHVMAPEVIVASKISMDKLSAEDQEIIVQAAKESTPYQKDEWAKYEAKSIEKVTEAGVTITELTDDERAVFAEACQPLYEEFGGQFGTLVEDIQALALKHQLLSGLFYMRR